MAIRQLGKNKYQLIVDYYNEEGKRRKHTKTVYCNGKRAAKSLLDDFADSWADAMPQETSVSQLLQDYIDKCEIKGLKPNTIRGYKNVRKRVEENKIGSIAARNLTTYQIEKYIVSMIKDEKLDPKTVKNRVSLLKAAYKMAIRNGLLRENPCDGVELPKIKRADIKIFTEEEVRQFMEKLAAQDLDMRVMCELALFCGLRRGEILGLRTDDIDFDKGCIYARHVRYIVEGETVFEEPKTEKSRRSFSCPQFILNDIRDLIQEHSEMSDSDFLIQYVGEPMKPDYASNKVIKFIDSLDMQHVTLHGLRHTFASMLNASGDFDIAEISSALGHSNITTTMNIYVDVFNGVSHSSKRISNAFDEKYGHKE